MIREKIKNLIQKAIKELQEEKIFPEFERGPLAGGRWVGWSPEIKVEHPEEKIHGDYSTNVAMAIAKLVEKEPMETAKILGSRLKVLGSRFFERVEVAKPGFINFFLKKEFLQKQVREILKNGEKFGQLKIGKNIKTNVEFISANPTGQLHIGNGRGAFWGDCLANVLEKAGFKVVREYYVNDAKNSAQIQELGKTALGRGKSYLTPYLKKLILELGPTLKKIKSESEAGFFLAQNILQDIKEFTREKLKIRFNFWISEQNLYREGKINQIYEFLKSKEIVYEKEGAVWLNLSKFNQKDEVLIRENGQPTYFLSDIAYHKYKIDRGFKKIIDIWGADHQGHVPRMKAAMKILGFKGDFDVLISQIVSLKGKKISKRKGKIVPLEWLIDKVGLDVARFFYLQKSLDSQMEFDLKLAKEQSEKNPVFYVQYAHTRICGILRKSKVKSQKSKVNYQLLNHSSELELIKQLVKFPEIVEDCAKDYQLQRIPQYALNLATAFHQFYRDCKVLTENKDLREARLGLILATKQVIKNTLDLMGISAPERM
jgi:arginyl-tRNA synthetase